MGSFFFSRFNPFHILIFFYSYPPRYIYHRFLKFFTNNITISSILPFIDNEQDFLFIRDRSLNKTTVTEHEITSRISKAFNPNNNDTIDDPLVKTKLRQNSNGLTT